MNKIKSKAVESNTDTEDRRLNLVPLDDRHGLGGKVIGVANAGSPTRVGISLADCRYHVHALGPTGTGKTTLLMRMILDDVEAGRGVAGSTRPRVTSSVTCWPGYPRRAVTGWS
ncbi:GTPase domain-containing protein [Rhizomonospora bruguierae]|uniref:GTPase domain-containing protein n=1 Tax=Rhizomonospora bruguierae TaxID=1581705 RepID=UPI0020C0D59F|nr:GTPase domain-containing protein [Micromonospora sp. NBRC 107566]